MRRRFNHYAVEVLGYMVPDVISSCPLYALQKVLADNKIEGMTVREVPDNYSGEMTRNIAKVSLLGGMRESVKYYFVTR